MDVMLDLETLSTRGNAAILVIAAIKFDSKDRTKKEIDTFYRKIDIKSCQEYGMDICKNTMDWWKNQNKAVYEEAFSGERMPLETALEEFSEWFEGSKYIWSQGACFDIPILSEAYELCDIEKPWKFYDARDTRTIYHFAGIFPWDLPRNNEHHALYDCKRQIWGVHESLRRLGLLP